MRETPNKALHDRLYPLYIGEENGLMKYRFDELEISIINFGLMIDGRRSKNGSEQQSNGKWSDWAGEWLKINKPVKMK